MQIKRHFLTPMERTLEKPLTVGFAVRCEPSRERSATPTLIPASKIGRLNRRFSALRSHLLKAVISPVLL